MASLLMLALFRSLAVHMHGNPGRRPESIGERGFPRGLVARTGYFTFLALSWPAAFPVCLAIRRWRNVLFYPGMYAPAFFACLGAMLPAPAPFLYWWRD